MDDKLCIIIGGPTAVGKTLWAVRLAENFGTEIISADSRQCFRELNIGVAKPEPEYLARIPHYFINSHSVSDEVNASIFEEYALAAVHQIFEKKNVAIMAGGTGLYIKAFEEGMDPMPEINPEIRTEIRENYELKGLEWLQKTLQKEDPVFSAEGEMKNPQRMMRALEVKWSSGKSLFEYFSDKNQKRNFRILKVGFDLPREILYEQINFRVDEMMRKGLLDEVKSLSAFRNLNALQTVGYKELFEYFDSSMSLDDAVENIKKNTRNYAKRQLTWFKRNKNLRWFHPKTDENTFIQFIQDNMRMHTKK
ncbi:MAG: tRNA (adenosine(37)-N6)-dimethylallyltransferase MiaA [Bacteroidetes bacterium]|nr:MAG: tRNA (adenosine(37)-N6)-dimethylallyltransferase MiaA [Bacteroidota bacterium]